MKACNNSNLIIKGRDYACYYCCMPSSRLAAYILPSSPFLLHISYCPHPPSYCIYTALVSLLFGTVIPTSFNILMKCFTPLIVYSTVELCIVSQGVLLSLEIHRGNSLRECPTHPCGYDKVYNLLHLLLKTCTQYCY